MAVAIVQSSQGAVNTKTITAATAGNLIVVFVSQSATTAAPTVTDSAGGTYTVLPTFALWNSSASSLYCCYKIAVGGETSVSYTPGSGGSTAGIVVFEVSGVNNPVLIEASKNTNNGAFAASSTTTAINTNYNNMVLAAVSLTASQTPGAWSGTKVMTTVATASTNTFGGSYVATTPLVAQTFTGNWTGSRNHGNLVVAFEPVYSPAGNTAGILDLL